MMESFHLLLFCLSLLFVSGTTASAPKCRIPIIVRNITVDVPKIMGKWYEYMYHAPGVNNFNGINTYTPIGLASLGGSGSNKWAVAVSWSTTSFVEKPARSCFGIFTQANFTADGKKTGRTWMQGTIEPVPIVSTTLFTDYVALEIAYRCITPGNGSDGMCQEPYFFVYTRVMPQKLNPMERAHVMTIATETLKPFCVNAKDTLKFTGWNMALPGCHPDSPPQFNKLVQNLRFNLYPYPTEVAF